jgi:hypothetical protein
MSEPRRWLRCVSAGLEVMLPAGAFRRCLPAPDPVPAVVDVEGERIPVAALADPAGGGPSPSLLLILEAAGGRLALPVTEVAGAVTASADDLAALPWPYSDLGWCAGVLVPGAGKGPPVLGLDLAALAAAAQVPEAAS